MRNLQLFYIPVLFSTFFALQSAKAAGLRCENTNSDNAVSCVESHDKQLGQQTGFNVCDLVGAFSAHYASRFRDGKTLSEVMLDAGGQANLSDTIMEVMDIAYTELRMNSRDENTISAQVSAQCKKDYFGPLTCDDFPEQLLEKSGGCGPANTLLSATYSDESILENKSHADKTLIKASEPSEPVTEIVVPEEELKPQVSQAVAQPENSDYLAPLDQYRALRVTQQDEGVSLRVNGSPDVQYERERSACESSNLSALSAIQEKIDNAGSTARTSELQDEKKTLIQKYRSCRS